MKVGDTVRLKHGGPRMTVVQMHSAPPGDRRPGDSIGCACIGFDGDGRPFWIEADPRALWVMGSEREATPTGDKAMVSGWDPVRS